MLRLEWTAYVTPDVVSRIATEAGVPNTVIAGYKALIGQILGCAGGLPFVEEEPPPAVRTAHGLTLFGEAVAHTLKDVGATCNNFGYVTSPGVAPHLGGRIVAQARVNINSANSAELATLPGLTAALVTAVLDERRRAGRFSSLDEFDRRVKGIGAVKAKGMAHAITFDDAHHSRRVVMAERGDLGQNLRALIAMQADADRPAAVERTLDLILTSCSTNPHPVTRKHELRPPAPKEAVIPHTAAWVGELWSDDYWNDLPAIIASATTSIDLCMFHITAPNPQHPTFVLIDAVRKAHEQGRKVRVLLDRDGKTDPYLSTVINSDAKRFFLEAGVPCRSDASNRLLHSKYLILDANVVVIGSHNWSKGSYFTFDDHTLAIASTELAAELGARFEQQWNTGS